MARFANFAACRRLLSRYRCPISSIPIQFQFGYYANAAGSPNFLRVMYPIFSVKRWESTNAEWSSYPEFASTNAYDILGVPPTSSFAEIKTAFRKLAKQTHPDLARPQNHSSDASKNFIRILGAYEILSDSGKRALYDRYIVFQRTSTKKHSKPDTIIFNYDSFGYPAEDMEVVEWLKWYRYTINDILAERRVGSGRGCFDVLESDFYSALHAAFYGPEIESMDLLPNCFEAEVRSRHTTSEVLHFVSGRELFGMVCLAEKYRELSHTNTENRRLPSALRSVRSTEERDFRSLRTGYQSSDAYKDLVLHLCGRVVAVATRSPPTNLYTTEDADCEDQIHVYLTSCEDQLHTYSGDTFTDSTAESRIALGVIKGLGIQSEEGTCYVYDSTGMKTHMILKHRTVLVKHLHWFRVGQKYSICECRCSRARMPPSKYWLFEPRSAMHDTGGWYVETFGKDNKGKTIPAQRFWDGLDTDEHFEERLHPAMYLLALAYRTLDIEDTRRKKGTVKERVEAKISNIFSWYKKSV